MLCCTPLWAGQSRNREFKLRNPHTGKFLATSYWADGGPNTSELATVNQLFRDHRSGEVHTIDIELLHILSALQETLGSTAVYEVISGYCSPGTNAAMHAKSSRVAKRSLHMQGRAIGKRLSGTPTCDLQKAAIELRRGGVGYYTKPDFVHLDTGSFRAW